MSVNRSLFLPALAFLLLLALFIPIVFADDNSLSTTTDSFSKSLSDQGKYFVDGTSTGGQAISQGAYRFIQSFGGSSCDADWVGPGTVIGMWLAPAVSVAIIVFIGIGIVYMLGQFFNSPQLISLAKDESYQSMFNILRVVFVAGMLLAANTWFTIKVQNDGDRVYNNKANPNNYMIDASMAFARLMVSDMVTHYGMLLIYNTILHTVYSATMWFGVTWRAMYSFNLGPVLKPLIDIVGSALQFLSLGISEWMLHLVTLCLIKKWTWTFFIPFGLLLSAFPYTRKAGQALIALSLALAIIYPFMFLFDYEVHKMISVNIVDAQSAMSTFINKSGLLSVFGTGLAIMLFMGGVFIPFFLGGALSLAFELIRGSVYYIAIMGVFLPFINIFVTLTAARELASFFKEDVNFMSFLKII